MEKITEGLREHVSKLLKDKIVELVIGYAYEPGDERPTPAFIRTPEQAQRLVFNRHCYHNLVTYLKKDAVARLKRVGLVVKGCDRRAVNVQLREKFVTRDKLYLIGVACQGVGEPELAKCAGCTVYYPQGCDIVLGEKVTREPADPFASIKELETQDLDARWAFWQEHLQRCIRCYACRQVCPLCTCKTCIADKNLPQWIDTSAHLRGNLAWHVIRAFHLTGRCIGCGECERVCPVDIPLGLLNTKMAKLVKEQYDFMAGMSPDDPEPFVSYNMEDSDAGIR